MRSLYSRRAGPAFLLGAAVLLPHLLFSACQAPAPKPAPAALPPLPQPERSVAPAPLSSSPLAAISASAQIVPDACPPLQLPSLGISPEDEVPIPPIADATHKALDGLYEHLAQLLRGRAKDHVRIGIYGDSNMTMDWITGEMRRVLQGKFGDAGHGFVAVGKPWGWYHHMDVKHGLWEQAWTSYAISTNGVMDGAYGFSGIAAQSNQVGAKAFFGTADESSPVGKTVNRFDIYYLRRPGNGTFTVRVDGKDLALVDTNAPELPRDQMEAGFHAVDVPDAPHSLEMITVGPKPVRLLGVTFDRTPPSIQVDSLGIGGAGIHTLAKARKAVAIQTLRRRKYDLIAFLMGTNSWDLEHQGDSVRKVVGVHREARPKVGVLFMSPPDHAKSLSEGRSDPWIVKVSKLIEKQAAENDCAFWDFRGAMGGELSIVRFHAKGWAWRDLIHLNQTGAAYMAHRLVFALWRDFAQWLTTHPQAGCDSSITE